MRLSSDSQRPAEAVAKDSIKGFYSNFKTFAFKGNVVDLAVGTVIGTAFAGLIKALVDYVIMPLTSLFLPTKQRYTEWAIHVDNKIIPYGKFIAEFINFIIIALVVYIFVVKFIGWFTASRKATPPAPTKEELLLTEIRDILKKQSNT